MAEHCRVRHRRLQTPVRVYTHPTTARRITLVGTMHIGSVGYYTGLRDVIDQAEAVVCHEGMGEYVDTERRNASSQELRVLDALRRLESLTRHRASDLGWVFQPDALTGPGWTNVDRSPLEVAGQVGPDAFVAYLHTAAQRMDTNDPNRFRFLFRVATALAATDRVAAAARQKQATDPVEKALVDGRNRAALAAVEAISDDVVLVWGAEHLPGLAAGVHHWGFVLQAETWHTVGRLPSALAALTRMLLHQAPHRRQPDTNPATPADTASRPRSSNTASG